MLTFVVSRSPHALHGSRRETKTRPLTAAVAAVLTLINLPAVSSAQSWSRAIDMSRFTEGTLPPDFVTTWRTGQGSPGSWLVIDDATATQGKAIAQDSATPVENRFPLAVYTPVSAQNVMVSVRFKTMAGKLDQAAGIAVRLTSPSDYYVVRASVPEQNVVLYRMVKGIAREIAAASVEVSPEKWHTLALHADGDQFSASFDDKNLFAAQDGTLLKIGLVALWTKADSVARFDALKIRSVP